MNRREFVKSAIATVVVMVVGVAGMFEMTTKAAANQVAQQQAPLQLPAKSTQSVQSTSVQEASSSSVDSQSSSQAVPSQSAASPNSSSSSAPAGYFLAAEVSNLGARTSEYFTHPLYGNSILLSLDGQWRAFSATCTHRACTLEFLSSELYCPCHGATFNATNGAVTRGPAQVTLGEYGVVQQNGAVYVSDSIIN